MPPVRRTRIDRSRVPAPSSTTTPPARLRPVVELPPIGTGARRAYHRLHHVDDSQSTFSVALTCSFHSTRSDRTSLCPVPPEDCAHSLFVSYIASPITSPPLAVPPPPVAAPAFNRRLLPEYVPRFLNDSYPCSFISLEGTWNGSFTPIGWLRLTTLSSVASSTN